MLKGTRHTEETIRKMSETKKGKSSGRKGIPCSEKTKRRLSELMKGRIPWNKGKKGKPHTEEFKERMRELFKGRIVSEETKRKRRETWKQRGRYKHTKENKKIMSKLRIAFLKTPKGKEELRKLHLSNKCDSNPQYELHYYLSFIYRKYLPHIKLEFEATVEEISRKFDTFDPVNKVDHEFDGVRWHTPEDDIKRNLDVAGAGIITVRWGYEDLRMLVEYGEDYFFQKKVSLFEVNRFD